MVELVGERVKAVYKTELEPVKTTQGEISMLTGNVPKTINMNRYRLRKSQLKRCLISLHYMVSDFYNRSATSFKRRSVLSHPRQGSVMDLP